jgi:hypothetical protein
MNYINLNSKLACETTNRFRRILFGPGYPPTLRTGYIKGFNAQLQYLSLTLPYLYNCISTCKEYTHLVQIRTHYILVPWKWWTKRSSHKLKHFYQITHFHNPQGANLTDLRNTIQSISFSALNLKFTYLLTYSMEQSPS